MRIALITVIYKNCIEVVYNSKPWLKDLSYNEQKKIVDKEISIWASGWENAFIKKGFEVISIPVNIKQLQLKWAEENNFHTNDIHEIAFQQLADFKPDILWYDYVNIPLIKRIKSQINSIKFILGWTGSAIVNINALNEPDLVISCAPETVNRLKSNGIKAIHLNHAFNPLLLEEYKSDNKKKYSFTFIGQIIKGGEFHYKREMLLKKLVSEVDLTIFSPISDMSYYNILMSLAEKTGYYLILPLVGLNKKFSSNKYLNRLIGAKDREIIPYDLTLKRVSKEAVYGIEMYNVIRDSLIVLNIHADSSPDYASNMRLFETTGVGSCLLTDWRKNINDLFEDNIEIITFKSDSECIEKAKWLIDNPQKCLEIGEAGQKKIFANHTYDQRIEELLQIINKYV